MLAVSIEASSAAATGASSPSNTAALPAGAATTTASAVSRRPSGTGPTASSKPVGIRRSARTGVRVRTSKPPPVASCSASRASPPATLANTGPGTGVPATAAASRSSEPPAPANRSASAGTAACNDSARDRPA